MFHRLHVQKRANGSHDDAWDFKILIIKSSNFLLAYGQHHCLKHHWKLALIIWPRVVIAWSAFGRELLLLWSVKMPELAKNKDNNVLKRSLNYIFRGITGTGKICLLLQLKSCLISWCQPPVPKELYSYGKSFRIKVTRKPIMWVSVFM